MGMYEGRPKKAIRQEKNIGFFVTKMQYFIIQEKAARAGVNLSDYLRQTAVFGQVKTRWTEEERELFKKLVGICNDISLLVRLCQQEGAVNAVHYFERYRDLMDLVLKRFGHDQ
jgi:hypothetical protein